MDDYFVKLFGLLAVFLSLLKAGTALDCYQCDSTLNNNCQEMWDHNLKINEKTRQKCNLYGAEYCVKVTGMWGGVVGTHRFCSSKNLGDQCQDIWFPHHDRMYRACVYTCSGDGCNGASKFTTVPVVVISVLSTAAAVLYRML